MRTHLPAIHSAFSRVPAIIEPMRYKSTASAAKTTRSSAVSPLSRFLDTEDNFFTPSFGRPVELMKLSRLLDAERDWFNAQYMYFNRMNTFGALGHEKPDGQAHFVPGYQLSHDEKTVRIAVDLPGVRMDDINVDLTNDDSVLHISGGRKFEVDGKVEQFIFDKRFTLGEGVDIENMSANLVDGVLTVTAPKLELDEAQAENGNNRKIPITAFDPNLDG
eukprot:CAMPEP_0178719332 /NCGR_PEP_ID=MMETSP0699-20121125/23089_1 /TAXON_ID=265572 /ORGANISM="Extubocellulus spinifer, Strain CCMP396" /LENGTH=218 /DNA_ID=CAMNT_0020369603 /DNA_START=214 /DNA_END=870 /DNA_ORIENTATION=-